MKIANVVSVQDRGSPGTSSEEVRLNTRVERMSTLLRRYPTIEPPEREELLAFLTGGSPEEIVHVTHLPGLQPRYQTIRKDHPREFASGLRGWLPMLVFLVLALAAVAWRLLS